MRYTGHTFKGNSDAMGEPYHGHASVTGISHRTADRGVTQPQAVWPEHGPYIEDNVKEHLRAFRLPADRCTLVAICR